MTKVLENGWKTDMKEFKINMFRDLIHTPVRFLNINRS